MNSHSKKKSRGELVKHAALWLLLGLELLPFYMMMQISLKDNDSFLSNSHYEKVT